MFFPCKYMHMKYLLKHLIAFGNSFINSFRLYKKHDTLTLGAALSYYTGFSLIPILILVISLAGSVLGDDTVEQEIRGALANFVGTRNAHELEGIIKVAYLPVNNAAATIIAIILLLIGATSVFSQLHTSLNLIWDVKNKARQPIMQFFVQRLFSFAMIICISFLLLVSFLAHTALDLFSNYLNSHLPQLSVFILRLCEFVLSYCFTALLFGMVFKYLSDARPTWTTIWPGALFTAVLFLIGKYFLGIYMAQSNINNSYGAVGAIVLLLTWVFYSSQIVFFGAEFTHAFAAEHGKLLDSDAVRPNADAGMKPTHVLAKK